MTRSGRPYKRSSLTGRFNVTTASQHGLGGARPGEEVAETAFSVGSAYPDPCAVCGEPSTQLRYELHRVAFHHRCHKIWEEEAAKPIRR
jgi:hypothetical protein